MGYKSKYTGAQVDAALAKANTALQEHQDISGKQDVISDLETIRSGASKGATALQNVPSEYVTETELTNKGYATTSTMNTALEGKVDKVSGKQLSTEDFTTGLKTKLNGLSNYDDTTISNAISKLRTDFDTLVSGDTTSAIKSFNDIIAFLDGISDSEDLESIVASIEQQIAGKQDKIDDLATIRSGAALGATALQTHQDISGKVDKVSGKGLSTNDYTTTEKNKLSGIESGAEVNVQSDWNVTDSTSDAFIKNKPTIPSAITVDSSLSSTSTNPVQNKVVKEAIDAKGTYSKPSGGIPNSDLANSKVTISGTAVSLGGSITQSALRTALGLGSNAYTSTSYLSTTGTAAAATKLANKRTIWGQDFDGTGNITGDMTVTGNIESTGHYRCANGKGVSGAKSDGTYINTLQPRNASNETILTYGTGGLIIRNEAGFSAFNINNSRNIGIRTSPSSSYNVYIAGSVYADNQLTVAGATSINGALSVKSTMGVTNTAQFEKDVTMFAALKFYSGGVVYGYGSDGKYQQCFWPRASDITYLNYGTKGFKIRNNSSTEIMVVDANDATTFKKDVTVSGTFSNPSSLVLKNVIDRDGLTLEQLSKIKPARFTWKDGRDSFVHIGGIADEVKEVMHEIIHEQEDGTYTMEYANAAFAMVSSLVKYVEQNQNRIEELEKEIAELKKRL